MNVKLTLRMDERTIRKANREVSRRGKSVSQMAAEFFESPGERNIVGGGLPRITKSLLGALRRRGVSERDYKRHLKEKYL